MGTERWLIGFVETALPWWLRILTRKWFRHVVALKYDPDYDIWVYIEWSSRKLFFELYKGEEVTAILMDIKERGSLLAVESEIARGDMVANAPVYCVTWVKHLVGFKNYFCLTPYHLYCELKKRGADVIFEKT